MSRAIPGCAVSTVTQKADTCFVHVVVELSLGTRDARGDPYARDPSPRITGLWLLACMRSGDTTSNGSGTLFVLVLVFV